MNNIEITTMCALKHKSAVLMINRIKSWKGWAFPGGHLEAGESLSDCIIREMYEETGINVTGLRYKGITNIFNTQTKDRHIIVNFTASSFTGCVERFCDEGEIRWVNINDIDSLEMAEGMRYRLPLFFQDNIQELYIEWDESHGYTKVEYKAI